MLEIRKLTLGICATNCYVVKHDSETYVIDPADNAQEILKVVQALGGGAITVLLTHAHFDHILALEGLHAKAVYAHPLEEEALCDSLLNVSRFMGAPFTCNVKIVPVTDGEQIGPFRVLHTPGHRPGCLCFYAESEGVLFSGDTLFERGYGRLDLPQAEPGKMASSLKMLFALPAETKVFSGHGADTTIGRETERMLW